MVSYSIENMQFLASEQGGKCLSKEYWGMDKSLSWMCSKGHTWDANVRTVIEGGWCVQCFKNKEWLKELKKIANKNGGKCHAENYVNIKTKLEFECKNGHRWLNSSSNVIRGAWCFLCKVKEDKERSLNKLNSIAGKKGGICLSKNYVDIETKLKFQCANGHTWLSTPKNIVDGKWCEECYRDNLREKAFDRLKLIAKKKGGKCLTLKYESVFRKFKWQCKEGHTWLMTPAHIHNGRWCKICRINSDKVSFLDQHKIIAKEKGGKCLSSEYTDYTTCLKWQCAKGHKFSVTPEGISKGFWCKICSRNEQCESELRKLKTLAIKKGGKCLSSKFTRTDRKLKWQCGEGHIWKAIPTNIKLGTWCPICAKNAVDEKQRKYTIPELRDHAKKRGGKMLSETYLNTIIPLKWKCDKGHIWMANAYSVIDKGSWCQKCMHKTKKLIIAGKNPKRDH